MKIGKRVLCLFLTILLCFEVLPIATFAQQFGVHSDILISPHSMRGVGTIMKWSQGDSSWGSIHIGTSDSSSKTMTRAGCAITSIAVAICNSGLREPGTGMTGFTPGTFCNDLKTQKVVSSGGSISWNKVNLAVPGFNHVYDTTYHSDRGNCFSYFPARSKQEIVDSLTSFLNKGYSIILEVPGNPQHYVCVVESKNNTIYIVNPAGGYYQDLFEKYTVSNIESKGYYNGYGCCILYKAKELCSHTYSTGHCTKCGALQPLQNSNASCTTGIYYAKEKVYLRTDPYETGANNANNCQLILPKDTEVTVEGAVVNGIGNTWYKVVYGSNTGYIYAQKLGYRRAIPASIKKTADLTAPTEMKVGGHFHISGIIEATNCKITQGRAYFIDAATDEPVPNLQTPWVTINDYKLNLNNHTIDNKLNFGKLPRGTYCYCVELQTDKSVNGKSTHIYESPYFTIGATTVEAPSITEISSGIGTKTFKITGTGTVYYRINAGDWKTGTTVTVNNTCRILAAKCVVDGISSNTTSINISIPALFEPVIKSVQNSNGATVTISNNEANYCDATIYYSLNGTDYSTYTAAFTVTKNTTVYAYSQRTGYTDSPKSSASVSVSAPSKPTVVRDTSSDIADGTAMTIHWTPDALAASYTVTVKKNGTQWKTETVSAAQYSFATNGAGKYDVSVVAKNVIGNSATSNTVSCTAHAPSTVTFKDWDGTVLSVQTVSYGGSATKPATPSRRGYTFDGWDKSYTNITSDTTIVAEYTINTYTVTFYDVDGSKVIQTQYITFNESIDSAAAEQLVNIENGGRVFSGWYIVDADDDSERDLEHIDSNMKLRAVTVWGNENLPVFVDNISAVLCYDSNNGMFNGYRVTCRVSTADEKDINAKIIVTLLAVTDEETGACKMINTKIDTINLTTSSSNMTWTGDILCDGTSGADYIEISVVSVEGNDRTGGLISETKRYQITNEAARFWSEWMTADELSSFGHSPSDSTVDHKIQYSDRTNTKSTVTTTSSTAPAGYTLQADNSYWTAWSGWSTEPVTATATRQVKTEQRTVSQGYTEYRYGSWYNGSSSHFCGACISGAWKRYTDWSTTRYSPDKYDTWGYCPNYSHYENGYHVGYTQYDGTKFYWNRWTIGGKNYYWEESRWIDTSYSYTVYSYRDYIGSYTYYKWDYGNWTDWVDTVLTDNDLSDLSYEVRTRDMYRYVVFDASQIQPSTSGTTQTISGKLEDANTDLSGRLATIFVYKSLNSDPTESQLEYIGQTTLGANGSYSFTFTTKEDVSEDTGDFVVALAVEGGNGLINVGMVKYDRPTYAVTFATENGTISTQQVEEGCSASVPEAPEMEGYTFTGWNKSTTNVTRNMTVVAQYKPKDCCVVFVDYLNQECELVHFDYGTVLNVPSSMENPTHEGYTFTGWSFGSDATVKGDMIVSALWEVETYLVTFYNEDGTTPVSTQLVSFGGFATPPATLDVDSNKMFLAWSDDNPWWNVTSDTSVYPIVAYKETTAAPASNLFEITDGLYEELTLTSEDGATILYTLDGSDPVEPHDGVSTEGTTLTYTGPITLTEDTVVRAKAVRAGKNDSDITEITFRYKEELDSYNDWGEAVDLKTQNVSVNEFDSVTIQVDLTSNPRLAGYGFYIKADPSVFYVDFDRTTMESTAASGTLCADGGSIIVENYDEVLGWHVLWVGDPSTLTKGSLLKLTLVAGAEITNGAYPVTVGYTTGDTFGADNEQASVESIANVTISAKTHEHRYTAATTSATCTAAGKTTYTCEICADSYTEAIPALGHNYNYTVTTAPTTTSGGKLQGSCSRCSTTSAVTLPKLSTTDYTYQVKQVATCTATGTGTYTWKVTTYGTFSFDVTLPKGNHNYVDGFCTVCGAADPNYTDAKLVISGLPVNAGQGETIKVPVAISGEGSFAGFTLSISSTEGLTLTNIEKGALLKETDGSFTKNPATGSVNFTNAENIDGNGELFVLTFTVSDEVAEGSQQTITIQIKDNKATNFVDETGAPVAVRFNPITVTIRSILFGDVDGDGDITTADAVKLVRFLVDLENLTEQQKLAADVSHDNDITSADSIKLVRYLVGLEDTLEPNRAIRSANASPAAIVKAESVIGTKGATVTVPVTISGNPGFAGFTFEVSYPDTLELMNISTASMLNNVDGGSFTYNLDKRLINWTSAENLPGDGELFYLTFRVLADVDEAIQIKLTAKDEKESNFANEAGGGILLNIFEDMPEKAHWAFEAINWALGNKITSGTTATTFSPNADCTRAQVVTFLWRSAGEPEPAENSNPFEDVAENAYYYKAVLWAAENGITAGTSATTFSPNEACTRGQIVTFIWRYEGSPETRELDTSFADVKAGAYYEKAVLWAAEVGITAGTSATTFSPNASCTRAQIVTFLYRTQQ